jgi:hypothetical protein
MVDSTGRAALGWRCVYIGGNVAVRLKLSAHEVVHRIIREGMYLVKCIEYTLIQKSLLCIQGSNRVK